MKNVILISISTKGEIKYHVPLALYYLKASLMEEKNISKKANVEIKKFLIEESDNKILKYIKNSKPDIVGFSCYVWGVNKILSVCSEIKKYLPGVKIVLGGPEVSPIPIKMMKENPFIDVVVSGEGEVTFTELIKSYLFGIKKLCEIPGITFRGNGNVIKNEKRPLIKNLDDIPSPFLKNVFEIKKGEDVVILEPCRGCFFKCHYCYYHKNYKHVRYFSIKRLEKEIKHILDYEPKLIYILDPSFGTKKDFVDKICHIISKYNRVTSLRGEVNAELMDEKMVNNLKRANFTFIEVGLQSSNRQTLKNVNRDLNLERFKRGFNLIRKSGIHTDLHLIVGLPGDNLKKFKNSINFALSLKPNQISLLFLSILPGTYLYENAEKIGIKFEEKAPHRIISNKTFSSEDISRAFYLARKFRDKQAKKRGKPIRTSPPREIMINKRVPTSFYPEGTDNSYPESFQSDKRFTLRLGFACNNNCVMCYFSDKLGTIDIGTEEAKENILLAKKENVSGLVLTGGEPTIRSDFLALLHYAFKLGIPAIEVQTNGRMFYYEEFVKKMADIQKDNNYLRFLVPIYGHNERIHDSITRSPGSFNQTIQGIKNLLKYDQRFIVKTVIMKPNYKHLSDIAKLLTDLNIKGMTITSVCIPEGARNHIGRTLPRFKEVIPYLYKALETSDRKKLKISLSSIPLCLIRGYENFVSEKVSDKIIISKYPGKEIREFKVPENATRDSQDKTKLGKCRKCRLFSKCGGIWKEYVKIYGEGEFTPVR